MAATSVAEAVYGFIQLGNFDALKKFTPDDFDWSQTFGHQGILPLSAALSNTALPPPAMFEWMIEAGADPLQKHPANTEPVWVLSKNDNPEDTKIRIELAGLSALTFAFAMIAEMRKGKGGANWSARVTEVEQILAILAEGSSPKCKNLSVPQSLVDMWESVREMDSTHNVVFEAADGEVSAHDLILTAASPVLKAMLASTMKEGSSKRIPVKDATSTGVRLFVDMLYTSSTREEPDYKMGLVALDWAHRWQVLGWVSVLSAMLQKMIAPSSFVAIAEAAVLMDLEPLQRACRTFGSTNAKVKAMLKKGTVPAAVRKLLGQPETPAAEEPGEQKRRRTFCAR
ncbi:unnamed protein product [Symbiodinium natans]|uniref:BTB domain-containing protein n=1 Tax=Symbiodinium natans TaxID=878477 RepID=A0A812LGP8_9DINO|nr:unnamed protein product [Symbiodinium natans]